MKKGLKRIALWGMLSIVLQLGVLTFIDKVIFAYSSSFVITEANTKEVKKEIRISLPSSYEDMKISSTGKYLLYKNNGQYMVKNIATNEENQVVTENNGDILYIDWIQDTNNLMIAEVIKGESGGRVINLVAYLANSQKVNQIKEVCNYRDGMEVDYVTSSGTTGSNYVAISQGGYSPVIYRININESLSRIETSLLSLGRVKAFQHKECVVFEDEINKRFYYTNKDNAIQIKFDNSKNLVFINVDNSDNIYMGELEGDKIKSIIYGSDTSNTSNWQKIDLEKAKKIDDIIISKKGDLLINDNLEGKITDAKTGNSVNYEGTFLQINSKYICSIQKGQLIMKDLEEINKVTEEKTE